MGRDGTTLHVLVALNSSSYVNSAKFGHLQLSCLIVAECDEKGKNAHEPGILLWKSVLRVDVHHIGSI